MDRVIQLLSEVFQTRASIEFWLDQPDTTLSGRTPREAIADGDVTKVEKLVKAMIYGIPP